MTMDVSRMRALPQPTTDGTKESEGKTFTFDRSFQEKIVQAMLVDRLWAGQFAEVLNIDFFQFAYLKLVASKYLDYYQKYREFPSMELLLNILVEELSHNKDSVLRDQIKGFLLRVESNQDLGDLSYVKDKSLEFCQKAGLYKAFEESASLINTTKYEHIVDIIKKAISAGNANTPGLNLFNDIDARYSETYRRTIGTGIPILDEKKILNGGLGGGELGVVIAPTGCHARGTEILMYDGSLKKVEEIQIDELLMGPDSKPRTVMSLVQGREKMYKITPKKGESFSVNENHILSLMRTNEGRKTSKNGEVVNLTVKEYLKKSKTFKHLHKLYRTGVEFETKTVLPLNPYVLGLLLGDGSLSKDRIEITTADDEILSEIRAFAEYSELGLSRHRFHNNKASGWYFTNHGKHNNPLTRVLRDLRLLGTNSASKFIPQMFKTASRNERLEVLAGLLDTDGSLSNGCFDYVSKSKQLADDVVFVCRSLGFAASAKETMKSDQHGTVGVYHRVCISGNISEIPVRIGRKKPKARQQKKNVLVVGFEVSEQEMGDFYGFRVSGDHLYLMGDFTATHNCGKTHVLVHFGAAALRQGKNVLHYSYEISERATCIRYDSNMLQIDSLECYEHKEDIRKFYEENKDGLGQLRVKYYPTGTATVNTLRAHMDKLAMTENFRPDMIIIDYAGIMRSTEKYELLRQELKRVFEDLRTFANECDVPVWTAVQSNKDGADKEYVDLTNMAESYGQAHVADFVLGLNRKSANKSTGYGNIFVAKNRNGLDGLQYYVHLDTARSTLRVLTDDEVSQMKSQADIDASDADNGIDNGTLSFLRKRFKDISRRDK